MCQAESKVTISGGGEGTRAWETEALGAATSKVSEQVTG